MIHKEVRRYNNQVLREEIQTYPIRKIHTVTSRTSGQVRVHAANVNQLAYRQPVTAVPSIGRRMVLKESSSTLTTKPAYGYRHTLKTGDKAWFLKHICDLEKLSQLPENWDSYGAETPNPTALYWGRVVLESLFNMNFSPNRVTPSVENGVGISFICGNKYADIECFNTGEILAVTSNRQREPHVWEVGNDLQEIKLALEKIRVFLRG